MKPVRTSAERPMEHRHYAGILQEHDHEPVRGLPESLPAGEHILWQGSPEAGAMTREVFHLRKLALYFLLLLAVRLNFVLEETQTALEIIKAMAPLTVMSVFALLCLWGVAWLSARHTLYTLTNRRLVMRIGIVLTVTFNIPFKRIAAADFKAGADGHGDVSVTLTEDNRIAWLQLWPHCRAWHLKQPQPTLRCIADAEKLGRLLSQAWSEERGLSATPNAAASSTALPITGQGSRMAVQ